MYHVWQAMCCENRSKIAEALKLYLVFESSMLKLPVEEFFYQVAEGGITTLQIRDKNVDPKTCYYNAKTAKSVLEKYDIPLIINDRVDLAEIVGADGVHLGVKDIPLKTAKDHFPAYFYGYSCNTHEDVNTANTYGAYYIGIGPAFSTSSKSDLRQVISREEIYLLNKYAANIPSVGIGGINRENITSLKGLNLNGAAVISAICASNDPYNDTRILRELAEEL